MTVLIELINRLLLKPFGVLIICLILGTMAITLDGSLYKYWSLTNFEKELDIRIHRMSLASNSLKSQIEQTKNRSFLERQARDRLDLVGQNEIVFVFSDEQ